MALLKKDAVYNRSFLMVYRTDHLTGGTGQTVTVRISKDGGAFSLAGGTTATQIGNGMYYIALKTTDTNTLGDLAFFCQGTNLDDTNFVDQVIGLDLNIPVVTCGTNSDKTGYTVSTVQDKTGYFLLGGTAGRVTGSVGNVTGNISGSVNAVLQAVNVNFPHSVNVTQWAGGTVSVNVAGVPRIDHILTNGTSPAIRIRKNQVYTNFTFPMIDSADHITLKTGLTVTSEVSIDGSTFGATTNSPVEIGATGIYKINLAAADLNGNNIMLMFSSAGADTRMINIVTQV